MMRAENMSEDEMRSEIVNDLSLNIDRKAHV